MRLKILTLILLGNITATLCPAQSTKCDSAISVCPSVFDKLIKDSELATQYRAFYIDLLAENKNYVYVISQKDSVISEQKRIQKVDTLQLRSSQDALLLAQNDLRKEEKKTKNRTAGMFFFGGLSVLTSLIALLHL